MGVTLTQAVNNIHLMISPHSREESCGMEVIYWVDDSPIARFKTNVPVSEVIRSQAI